MNNSNRTKSYLKYRLSQLEKEIERQSEKVDRLRLKYYKNENLLLSLQEEKKDLLLVMEEHMEGWEFHN